ncbi:AraC family transcriptional regulator [Streptomonospora sediminis]
MASDQLSEVFDLVEVHGMITGAFALSGRWVTRGQMDTPMKLLAVVRGRVRLDTDGIDRPIGLAAGDVAILNRRSWLELEGGEGDGPRREILPEDEPAAADRIHTGNSTDDVVIGGRVDLNPAGRALLLKALPPVGHVRASAGTPNNLGASLDLLFNEVVGDRMGSAFAIRQYGQLLLLEVLRAYVDQAELPPGWLRVLTDERFRPALRLMHAEPGKTWGLAELARASSMSRTSFAEGFRDTAGVPPLTYLNHWRMMLAQKALRDGNVRIGALAAELGYGSESAFSTAFKRQVGESPLRYRHRIREEPQVRAADEPVADPVQV